MGLPSLTINADLAAVWRSILEENGLRVCRDEVEEEQCNALETWHRVSQVPWRVGDGNTELQILEAVFRDREDGNVYLIFMPLKTRSQRQLFTVVHRILVASGATLGAKK